MRVLVAEDHVELADSVARVLRREGMAVDVVYDGMDALEHTSLIDYDVVILDRDLPKVHGDEVCSALVRQPQHARVLMLTASSTIADRVEGLSIGADDYLPKPFAYAELVARIRAIARRPHTSMPTVLIRGELRLDPAQRIVTPGGRAAAAQPQGVRRPRVSARCRRAGRIGGGTTGAGVGRGCGSVHHDRQGHDQPSAVETGRPPVDRDSPQGRLPDLRGPCVC